MLRHTIIFLFLLTVTAQAQDFNAFLARVDSAPEQRRQYIVDSFLTVVPGYPFIENDSTVHYLYTGEVEDVAVAGDGNNWHDANAPLQRLASTTLWYRSERYERDARLDYKFVVDKNWILDPRNPYTVSSGYGPNSELRMPGYISPSEIIPRNNIPQGRVVDTVFYSTGLQNSRDAHIYLPAEYEQSTSEYPLVLFHDGPDYLTLGHAATVLDNLIYDGRIPPCVALFLPAVDRNTEYAGNEMSTFTDFVVKTVIPAVERSYRTIRDPRARAVFGASNGGNIALFMAGTHPDVFGCAAAQSSNITSEVSGAFTNAASPSLHRLYLDLGTYDVPILLPLVRAFVSVLEQQGHDLLYHEFNEGHSWGSWRAHIDDALSFFFDDLYDILSLPPAPERSGSLEIRGLSPQPAHGAVLLDADVPPGETVTLRVVDLQGRQLLQLPMRGDARGRLRRHVDVSTLPAGMYFMRLHSPSSLRTAPLLIR